MRPLKLFIFLYLIWFVLALNACAARGDLMPVDPAPIETAPVAPATGSTIPDPDEPVTAPAYPAPADETPALQPWQPQPGDDQLARGPVYLDEKDLLTLESYPPQFMLRLKGSLPTPCHQLRVRVPEPDEQGRIQVEVYSVAETGKACAEVLQPFEQSIHLGSYTDVNYTVWVNGEQVGEIAP